MSPIDEFQPSLSIIIVTFNAGQFLPSTLQSLKSQSEIGSANVEVVIVDGGSTDDTLTLIEEFPFIGTVVSERDKGIYDAMNKGARLASGRWLQFLNAGDCFTHPTSLQVALGGLDKADIEGAPWAISAAQNLGGEKGVVRRIPSVPHTWWRHAYGLQPHCHQATWFKRTTFIDSGAHALKFGTADDFDVIVRFGMLACPFVMDDILINYLGGGVSEKAAALNPLLQHKVRVERMQLGPVGSAIDKQAGRLVAGLNTARKLAGRLKTKLQTAGRQNVLRETE
jgi:glycosyltransferase involved in cell wall biosynthesis